MTVSKNSFFTLDFYVNLSLGWNSLRPFRNLFKFSSESVQIKKISMNIFHSQGFVACVFNKSVSVYIFHKNGSMWWCKFSPSSHAWYLQIKYTTEFKKILFKHKIHHFYIFSGNHFVLEFIVLFSKNFQTSIMWNTWIKPNHICCNKDCPFRNFLYSL